MKKKYNCLNLFLKIQGVFFCLVCLFLFHDTALVCSRTFLTLALKKILSNCSLFFLSCPHQDMGNLVSSSSNV